MADAADAEFTEEMLDIYRRAKDEVGYNASRFRQMVVEHGGLATAKRLLHSPTVSDGYEKLWEEGRLDLSVEALVLDPGWASLFTEEELQIARDRLEEFGFEPTEETRPGGSASAIDLDSVLRAGSQYTRADIYEILSVPEEKCGGDWNTGYHEYEGTWFVFATIEASARTGHDYGNRWDGDQLVWHGRTGSRLKHPSIQHMLSSGSVVRVFTRDSDRGPFIYQGKAQPVKANDEEPVQIVWRFPAAEDDVGDRMPGEIPGGSDYPEGSVRRVTVDKYERNRGAREKCIEHWGAQCLACGFDFGDRYGEIGEGYIHVHHRVPLKDVGGECTVDPVEDLRPVCPNCHAMIHQRETPLTISEVKELLGETTSSESG